MYVFTIRGAVIAAAMLFVTDGALAQYRVYRPYRIRYQDQVVRDGLGRVIDRAFQNAVPADATLPVLSSGTGMNGSYYLWNGRYYYVPNTAAHGHAYTPAEIQFGGLNHVDDLSSGLERLANDLCLDLHYNYSHNPGFATTYREAYQLLEAARSIHEIAHRHDVQAIAARIHELDQLVHHVQDDVRGWTRHPHRNVGQLSVHARLDMIESTVHHLLHDVGVAPSGDGLASRRLETLARQVCLEMHYNYSHNPEFAPTYGEAYQLLDAARYVYRAKDTPAYDRPAVTARLNEINQLAHHLADDVRGWTRYPQRQVGQGDLAWKLERVDATVQELLSEDRFSTTPTRRVPTPAGDVGLEEPPAPPQSSH
jgi:hypothetical protein